jgi:CDP-6-deoxy-D-xylo-4-hexulose-3-dehydrase
VIIAHTLGNPFDLTAVAAFCKKHNLWLIEDNCDAAGSLYQGRKTGSFGALATLSFYPPHHMTMGEGGAVLINDERLIRPVESLRDWGKDCWCIPGVDNSCGKRFQWELGQLPCGYDHKYIFSHVGYNLKITDMQAAVGCAQLDKLNDFNQARRNNWAYFRQSLAPLADRIILPEPSSDSDPSWFGFMMTIRPEARFNRDELVRHLESKKIQTRMLFAGNLVKQPAFTDLAERARASGVSAPFRSATSLEKTDLAMTKGVWVGVYPGLTEAMREFVATEILSFANQR